VHSGVSVWFLVDFWERVGLFCMALLELDFLDMFYAFVPYYCMSDDFLASSLSRCDSLCHGHLY
jgi:hypothetical protein